MTVGFIAGVVRAVHAPLKYFGPDPAAYAGRARAVELLSPERARHRAVWAVLAALTVFYAFMASAGHFIDLNIQTTYYDRLARGFEAGHLYVIDPPSAVLLKQANPFAPGNLPHWMWDASYYQGHYYLYFGPVPALLLLMVRYVTGFEGAITDQWPTVLFLAGRLYGGAGLLLQLAQRSKWAPPSWLCALSLAVFGLAHPISYVAARTHVWETALAGGQCFLFLGLWLCSTALYAERFRRLRLLSAGALFGLAIGCRATMAVPTPLLILLTLGMLWYLGRRGGTWLLDALCLGIPFALLCGVHGWYNWARFGSPFEFGIRFQTTLQPFRVSPSYVLPNVFAYFFTPLASSCQFPFVLQPAGRVIPTLIGHPSGYATFEQLGGLIFLVSWIWLIPLAGLRLLFRRRNSDPLLPHSTLSAHEVWLAVAGAIIVLSFIPVLHLWVAAPRYPGDAVGGMALVGAVAAHDLVRHAAYSSGRWAKLVARVLIPGLGITTCVLAPLVAFGISARVFERTNPIFYQSAQNMLSFCPVDPLKQGLR